MNILQGGAPKCGNFWLYQIIQEILRRSNRRYSSFIERQPIYSLAKNWDLNFPEQSRIDVLEITDLQYSYRISSIFKMPIENIKNYIAQTTHVWTHSPVCKRSGEVFDLFDKKIYIVRDPRDRALSAAQYYCSDYMLKYFPQEEKVPGIFLRKNYEKLMHEWVWHVFDHLRLSCKYNIHFVYYENLLLDFQREINRMLDYLQINFDNKEIFELEKGVSFTNLKKNNPKHLNKGTFGYWKEILAEDQKHITEIYAGPLLRFLGYPEINGKEYSFLLPAFHPEFDLLKQEIIESQKALYQI
jgi:aryl sulfotransferase